MMNEPLSPADAKKEAVRRYTLGGLYVSPHFRRAAAAEGLTALNATVLVLAGVVEFAEYEGGKWRYRVRNGRFVVVVGFTGDDTLDYVTIFKKGNR
jgi:hypothetical protein